MAKLPFGVNILLLMLLTYSDAFIIKPNPNSAVIPSSKQDSFDINSLITPNINAIVDTNFGKANPNKLAFGKQVQRPIKLKAFKVLPENTNNTNIMKLLFPRKKLTQIRDDDIEVPATVIEQTNNEEPPENGDRVELSSINKGNEAQLSTQEQTDFLEVDNVLLIRDPIDLNTVISDNKESIESNDNKMSTGLRHTSTEEPIDESIENEVGIALKTDIDLNEIKEIDQNLTEPEIGETKEEDGSSTKKPIDESTENEVGIALKSDIDLNENKEMDENSTKKASDESAEDELGSALNIETVAEPEIDETKGRDASSTNKPIDESIDNEVGIALKTDIDLDEIKEISTKKTSDESAEDELGSALNIVTVTEPEIDGTKGKDVSPTKNPIDELAEDVLGSALNIETATEIEIDGTKGKDASSTKNPIDESTENEVGIALKADIDLNEIKEIEETSSKKTSDESAEDELGSALNIETVTEPEIDETKEKEQGSTKRPIEESTENEVGSALKTDIDFNEIREIEENSSKSPTNEDNSSSSTKSEVIASSSDDSESEVEVGSIHLEIVDKIESTTNSPDPDLTAVMEPESETIANSGSTTTQRLESDDEIQTSTESNSTPLLSSNAKSVLTEKLTTTKRDKSAPFFAGLPMKENLPPLLSRIILGGPAVKKPLFMNPLWNKNIMGLPLRHKKNIKREAALGDMFVTPSPFSLFHTSSKRPSLIEKYRAASSAEKIERVSKVIGHIMHGVTIAGHLDGYMTNRAKHTIKKLHKLVVTEEA